MTHVDDLNVGQWVAITHSELPTPPRGPFAMFGVGDSDHAHQYDGHPLKILAISLPFIAVLDLVQGSVQCVDVRCTELQLLHRTYVKVAKKMAGPAAEEKLQRLAPAAAKGVEKAAGEAKGLLGELRQRIAVAWTCPDCGSRLTEWRVDNGTWEKRCPECGFGKGPNPVVKQ